MTGQSQLPNRTIVMTASRSGKLPCPHSPLPMRKSFCFLLLLANISAAYAQTPEQWVDWGDRVHGGFGSLIAYGIRIGLDAMQRMDAERRELAVSYVDGIDSPCPCVLDGIAIALSASVGQRTLELSPARAPKGTLGVVRITHRKTGAVLTYELPQSALSQMERINREHRGTARLSAVMELNSDLLFRVVP